MSFNVGDIIEYLGEDHAGWWRGKLHGKIGVFPSNFVQQYVETSSSTNPSDGSDSTHQLNENGNVSKHILYFKYSISYDKKYNKYLE